MIPTLLLVGAGRRRRFWIPLPVFLLWPLWLLGWVLWAPLWLLRMRPEAAVRAGLLLFARARGLRLDVDTDGMRLDLRFV